MVIEFTVGTRVQHAVRFHWGQFWGTSSVHIDNVLTMKGKPQFLADMKVMGNLHGYVAGMVRSGAIPWDPMHVWAFNVGGAEPHEVHIVKERPKYFAGLRPSEFRVVVDGVIILTKKGF